MVGLSIGTRPDCVDVPVLDLLQDYAGHHLIWLEYGLQSASDKTLELINRGHDVRCFENAVRATLNRGIKICAHVILGLPGESRGDILHTAGTISDLGIDGVMSSRVHPWRPFISRATTDVWNSRSISISSVISLSGYHRKW